MEKIFVTGLGVVSPLGNTITDFWGNLVNGSKVPLPNVNLPIDSMPLRKTYSVEGYQHQNGVGRASQFAIDAAKMCLQDAGLSNQGDTHAIGISLGCAMGDDLYEAKRMSLYSSDRTKKADQIETGFIYQVASVLSRHLGLTGPNLSVTTACSASLYSISVAADMMRNGESQAMLVGGAEAVSRVAMGCFNRLAAIDPVACRPFDRDRKGTVMGEGSAVMLLETESHMKKRGHENYYCTIAGEGWSCDSHHTTIPESTGQYAEIALNTALDRAGLDATDIDCVLAHGTGTSINDLVESTMINRVFANNDPMPWVVGVKGKLGHQGGAAGSFQALTAALMFHHQVIPPTGNTVNLDSHSPVKLAPSKGVSEKINHVVMNSYAFGGNNISLVMSK